MDLLTRREALRQAARLGAALAWSSSIFAQSERRRWREQRECFPQGVASGDPHADSVVLWTRRPPTAGIKADRLVLEVAEDQDFTSLIAHANARVSPATDWTCRVLAAGLKPSRTYWYRFIDDSGAGSRVGRTRTAPPATDRRRIHFAFVSCQNVTQGSCNAYRRMIWEDLHRAADDQLDFVLHLGDFVYEVVWYPEDRPQGMYDRRLREVVRYQTGEKIGDFHVPTSVGDYRTLYRGYLSDPDLQDARARWPFVCVWDNHEFSWKGWQSQQNFGAGVRPAQVRKVAANQAWFEYQPARVVKSTRDAGDRFVAPAVRDTPIRDFDAQGLGLEASNLAAIESLRIYRTLRWGANVELLITDNRSYRAEPVTDRADFGAFRPKRFPFFQSQDIVEILDAGEAYDHGAPPDTITFDGRQVPNPRKQRSPQSMLGRRQKAWFLARLRESSAPWKLWANSVAMLNWRTDLHNLPPDRPPWPGAGFGQLGDDDWSGYCTERNEIIEFARSEHIVGLVSIAGDRHSFLAGVLSTSLPPKVFEPVGIEFVVGSVSAPGLAEAAKYVIAKDDPLRPIYLYDSVADSAPQPALNVSIMHGVRSSLVLQQTQNRAEALAARNPDVAPHLSFADVSGHGYAVVRVDNDAIEVEFVAVPRPLERSTTDDGGPLAYRIIHHAKRWQASERPSLTRTVVEGTPPLLL